MVKTQRWGNPLAKIPNYVATQNGLLLFAQKGFEHELVNRVGNTAIYRRSRTAIEHFEVIRIRIVRSNNVLLIRFKYDYEVDLDRIKTERDLLNKTWMTARHIDRFIEAAASIKHFNVHRL